MINLQRAELHVCDAAASFLQSGFWGAFKSRFGWEALAFQAEWKVTEKESALKTTLLVLRRRLPLGFALAYIPWGPELPLSCINNYNFLLELAVILRDLLPKDTVFIRFDPPWHLQLTEVSRLVPFVIPQPFVRSTSDIQVPNSVILDLNLPMESILEQMKSKWRYNARLAIKRGVKVFQAKSERIICFYELLKKTAQRDGIAIHSFDYYKTLFDNDFYKGNIPDIRLYLAEHEEDLLAGIVTLFRGKEAVYLYGASSNIKRNLMASYALQLKAIEDAKSCGCTFYDFFGIPPDDDPSHPMVGLYRFKTGFGGNIIQRPGSWDFPCRIFFYNIFRFAEFLLRSLRTLKKKFTIN